MNQFLDDTKTVHLTDEEIDLIDTCIIQLVETNDEGWGKPLFEKAEIQKLNEISRKLTRL